MTPSKNRLLAVPAALAATLLAAACASNAPRKTAAEVAAAPAAAVPVSIPAASPAPAAPAMPTSGLRKDWGVVSSVDALAGTVTFKDHRGRTRTVRLAQGAKLTKGGDEAAITLADVKAGDRVTVRAYGGVAGAVHVNVLAATN